MYQYELRQKYAVKVIERFWITWKQRKAKRLIKTKSAI